MRSTTRNLAVALAVAVAGYVLWIRRSSAEPQRVSDLSIEGGRPLTVDELAQTDQLGTGVTAWVQPEWRGGAKAVDLWNGNDEAITRSFRFLALRGIWQKDQVDLVIRSLTLEPRSSLRVWYDPNLPIGYISGVPAGNITIRVVDNVTGEVLHEFFSSN